MSEDLEYILAPHPNGPAPPNSRSPDGVKASGRAQIPPEAKGPSTAIFSGIPEILPEAEFARLLGVDSATLRRMAADGVMVRAGKGLFDVRASLPPYIERLRKIAARHDSSAASEELKTESIRVKRAQADAQEIKNAALRGELLEAAAVERQWATILRDVRAALLAVPSRAGAKLPHLTAHDLAEVDREIRQALERLSDGN